jgi:hypothetical protein
MGISNTYNDKVVRQFAIMTVIWGIVGMAAGVFIAAQLVWPALNFDLPWLTYSRLRPLHTNAVIFAFGGCALFATSYYIVQRTCQTRLFSDAIATFTFWGWNLVILLAAITLPLGLTQSKWSSTRLLHETSSGDCSVVRKARSCAPERAHSSIARASQIPMHLRGSSHRASIDGSLSSVTAREFRALCAGSRLLAAMKRT